MKERRKTLYEYNRPSAIKDPNIVSVCIFLESGCSFDEREYEKYFTGSCLWSDFDKIEECIDNESIEDLIKQPFPIEETVVMTLMEDGEFEDVHFWKYFTIKKIETVEIEFTEEEEREILEEGRRMR